MSTSTNPILQFFANWRANLTKFEVAAVAAIDVQAFVLQLIAPFPAYTKIVTTGFGVLATLVLIVKNVLGNQAAAKKPTAKR